MVKASERVSEGRAGRARVAVGYCRVSTAQQASEGVSLDAQKARIEAWAKARGCEVGAIHVDAGLSGGRADNRPALQAALAQVCKEGGALVVYSLSRLARSTKDAILIVERLEKCGADLVSLSESIDTTSAAGRLFFRMMAAFAEFERDVIAERTSTALRHKQSRGGFVGGARPFGFRVDGGKLVADEAEQAALRRARELSEAGKSLRTIARVLHAEGLTDRELHAQSIARALASRSVEAVG